MNVRQASLPGLLAPRSGPSPSKAPSVGTTATLLAARTADDAPDSSSRTPNATRELLHFFKVRRLQRNDRQEIKPYEPKYERRHRLLASKLKEAQQGKRIVLEDDEIWEQTERWYQKPAKSGAAQQANAQSESAATGEWQLRHAHAGALIQRMQSPELLTRAMTPLERRKVLEISDMGKRNVQEMAAQTSEVQRVPFRSLVYVDRAPKAVVSPPRRGASRGGGRPPYYPPFVPGQEPKYMVPKCLLPREDRRSIQSRDSDRDPGRRTETPLTGIHASGLWRTLQGKTPGARGHSAPLSSPRTEASREMDAAKRSGTPMKFALPTLSLFSYPSAEPSPRRAPSPAPTSKPEPTQKRATKNCAPNCSCCEEVAHELNEFEASERRRVHRAMEEQLQLESQRGRASKKDRRAKVPVSEDDGSDLEDPPTPVIESRSRINSEVAKLVIKAAEKLKLGALKRFHRQKRKQNDERGVTVAQLYQGMTHRDREDLYISVVGGLSFDLTRERFSLLMQHVLAPRIGAVLTEEQIQQMFNLFDINHGGTISYFEYLASLCHAILTEDQYAFLTTIFRQLLQHRVSSAAARRASKAGSPPLQQRESLRGGNAVEAGKERTRLRSTVSIGPEVAHNAGRRPGSRSRLASQDPAQTLRRVHLDFAKLRQVVFGIRGHSLQFPHPMEDRFCHALQECFEELRESDDVDVHKFRLLCFCDDQVMETLSEIFPNPDFDGADAEAP